MHRGISSFAAFIVLVATLSVACIGSDVAEASAPLVLDYCSVTCG